MSKLASRVTCNFITSAWNKQTVFKNNYNVKSLTSVKNVTNDDPPHASGRCVGNSFSSITPQLII